MNPYCLIRQQEESDLSRWKSSKRFLIVLRYFSLNQVYLSSYRQQQKIILKTKSTIQSFMRIETWISLKIDILFVKSKERKSIRKYWNKLTFLKKYKEKILYMFEVKKNGIRMFHARRRIYPLLLKLWEQILINSSNHI